MQSETSENQGDNPIWEFSPDPFQMQSGTPENQGDNPIWETSPDPFQNQQYSDYRLPLAPGQFQYSPLIYTPRRKQSDLWQWYRTRTLNMKIVIGWGAIMAVLLFFSCIIVASVSITRTLTPPPLATLVPAAVIASPTVPQQTPIAMPTQGPASTPTRAPTQTHQSPQSQTACPGVKCNPWGYNFTPGNYITNPPSNFCSYFTCISDFWGGHGYVVECQDGKYTKLGGLRNPCMHHNGDPHPLYSH